MIQNFGIILYNHIIKLGEKEIITKKNKKKHNRNKKKHEEKVRVMI